MLFSKVSEKCTKVLDTIRNVNVANNRSYHRTAITHERF